jgi:hypothetical protein
MSWTSSLSLVHGETACRMVQHLNTNNKYVSLQADFFVVAAEQCGRESEGKTNGSWNSMRSDLHSTHVELN